MKGDKIENIVGNLYYLSLFVIWSSIAIAAISAIAVGSLYVASIIWPGEIVSIDNTISGKAFLNLKSEHHYHAAIDLMEYKQNSIRENDPDALIYAQELIDCYTKVGEYTKAEKRLLELYNNPLSFSQIASGYIESASDEEKSALLSARFSYAVDLFNLYDKTGDKIGLRKAYSMMKENESLFLECIDKIPADMLDPNQSSAIKKGITTKSEYYSVIVEYLNSPLDAICNLNSLLQNDNSPLSPLKIRFKGKLVDWMIEHNQIFNAYECLANTIEEILELPGRSKYEHYGTFIDQCIKLEDYESASVLLDDYWHYVKNEYAPEDMEYIKTQIRELKIKENNGNWKEIEAEISNICYNLQTQIENNILGMNEEQREFFVKIIEEPFNYAYRALAANPNSTKLAELCLNNQIFKKGLLLRSSNILKNTIAQQGDSELICKYDSLLKLKKEFNFIKYGNKLDPQNIVLLSQIKGSISDLDSELSLKCSDYVRLSDTRYKNHEELKQILSADEVLLELIDTGEGLDRQLFAILLKKYGDIQYIPICNYSELEKLIEKEYVDKVYNDPKLATLIWENIEDRIKKLNETISFNKETKKIYYSSNGIFSRLALHAFKYEGERLSDKYMFHLLSNAQNIVNAKENVERIKELKLIVSLWGGITYSNANDTIDTGNHHKGILRGDSLCYLPNSSNEVNEIQNYLEQNNHKATLYRREKATEQSFKNISGCSNDILHISTHGFFKDNQKGSAMHNSGLFFAGANKYWMEEVQPNNIEEEDGILYADEIQNLNLLNCKLAILSACDTGLGYVDANEGVFGLQRAFKLAGVKKILMSMWSVSDRHTALLMKVFYNNLLSCHLDIEAAYAQTLHETSHNKADFPSVSLWGGFVLMD